MKVSLVVSTQPASFSALAFKERLPESLSAIKRLGYDGVELAIRDPQLIDVDELERLLAQCGGLPVSALGTGQAYGEEGLSLVHHDPKVRSRAVARIKAHMRLAARLKAVVIIGLIRGRREESVSFDQAETWLQQGIEECAREDPSVKLAVEPINRYETNLLNSVAESLRFLRRVEAENVGLLLDTFHMNIEEPSLLCSIESAAERLLHVHVADSNRWYPGAGHIDFAAVLTRLDRLGYQGYCSAEILPLPAPDTAAAMAILQLRRCCGQEAGGSADRKAAVIR
ncbi:MAG: 5-keto-L-gluconate epimerase [Acidobacteriota bacterium]